MKLQPLEPRRVRRPRGAYGWVDMRAVTQGHLEEVGTAAALTYLFLCSVGDTAGLSFWSRERMRRVLGLDEEVVKTALDRLVAAELIARQGQVVQVLPIPGATEPATPGQQPSSRTTGTTAVSGSAVLSSEAEAEPPIKDSEVQSYLPQARAQMARFLGQKAPAEAVLFAVARSLTIKARRDRRG